MLNRVGIAFTPFETRAGVVIRLTQRAERRGLGRVDIAEGWAHNALVLLSELAVHTSRIGLGTTALSAWGRSPATLAASAVGLQRASRGRFTLGLAAGSPPLPGGSGGEVPVLRLRELLLELQTRLGSPLALAAITPGSIRLAGELADEWAPLMWARSRLDVGRELSSPAEVVVAVPLALGPDEASARELAGSWLAAAVSRMGPQYPCLFAEHDEDTVDALIMHAGGRGLPVAAEGLADDVLVHGTYDEAGELVARWFAAGADRVQLVLPPGRPEEELAQLVDLAAGAVPAGAC